MVVGQLEIDLRLVRVYMTIVSEFPAWRLALAD